MCRTYFFLIQKAYNIVHAYNLPLVHPDEQERLRPTLQETNNKTQRNTESKIN